MAIRYVHTNLIARDFRRLASFYVEVFGCELVPPERDIATPALEAATKIPGAHLVGAHLRLPGHGPNGPTLELFEYVPTKEAPRSTPDRAGFGHLAFEVDDVDATLARVLAAGGERVGDTVDVGVKGAGTVRFVYVRDPEGNILELQSWSR